MFQYFRGIELCYECRNMLEDKFEEVKEYIAEREGTSITQISRECRVPESQLKEWLKEDRLELVGRISAELTCEKCGKGIYEGHFCTQCKGEMLRSVGNSLREDKLNELRQQSMQNTPRMHFIRH
ncbi:MAG: FeoC-like transcriptional regulator [Bacteroides fragilis]|nr:FeoC-like transcriptional regulator [Bacteroides fragilis]